MSRAFNKFRQKIGESMGGAAKTEASEEFKDLVKETEKRKQATEALFEAYEAYVKTLGKKKETAVGGFVGKVAHSEKKKLLPLEGLGDSLILFSQVVPEDSSYCKALVLFGETTEQISIAQMEYAQKIQDGYGSQLSYALSELKEYTNLSKKLESRRLDFDAKLNKMDKSKKDKPENEEAVRSSQLKYEDTLEDITKKMLNLSTSDDDQLDDLLAFVDAELEYFQRCQTLVKTLHQKLSGFPRQNLKSQNERRNLQSSRVNENDDRVSVHSRASTNRALDDNDHRSNRPSNNRGNNNERDDEDDRNDRRDDFRNDRRDDRRDDFRNDRRDDRRDDFRNDRRDDRRDDDERDSRVGSGRGVPVFPYSGSGISKSPSAPVITYKPQSRPSASKQVKVLFDFKAEGPDELSIYKGDQLEIITEIDAGWWEGRDQTGKQGIFPSNYVQVIESKPQSSGPPLPQRRKDEPPDVGGSRQRTSTAGSTNSFGGGGSGRIGSGLPTGVQASAAMRVVGQVSSCSACGCGDFAPNAFKSGQCNNCFHKH